MDDREMITKRTSRWIAWSQTLLLGLVSIPVSCRVPDPPVLKNKSTGVIYDTAMEEELRSGQAHALLQSSMVRYIDTLAESSAVTQWSDDGSQWSVFVATNRGWFAAPGEKTAANRVLDEPEYGRCEVSLPRQKRGEPLSVAIQRHGDVIIPASSKSADPTQGPWAVVASEPLDTAQFFDGVTDQIVRSRQSDLLIFVHGFNVPFESAVASAARLALDIPFNGAVVAYCWPTQGGVGNYKRDEPINLASVEPLTLFLASLLEAVPDETRIHIVVHSMGNRIVMQSLNQLSVNSDRKPIANVVLCAPDVGRSDFEQWIPGVVAQSDRVTLYANQSDSALIASKGVHGEMRAGDAWIPMIIDGVETIDCSRIDFTLMGHSYFSENADVLGDLFMLLKEDLSASQRPHLDKRKSGQRVYWQFARTSPSINYTWHYEDSTQRDHD